MLMCRCGFARRTVAAAPSVAAASLTACNQLPAAGVQKGTPASASRPRLRGERLSPVPPSQMGPLRSPPRGRGRRGASRAHPPGGPRSGEGRRRRFQRRRKRRGGHLKFRRRCFRGEWNASFGRRLKKGELFQI